MRRLFFFVSAILCLAVSSASAQFSLYKLVPEQPFSNRIIELEVFLGCKNPDQNSQGLGHNVQLTDNQLDVFLVFDLQQICGIPPIIFGRYDIGTLEAGEYTLRVFRVPPSIIFPANPDEFEVVLEQTFGVNQSAEPVPTVNTIGLVMIILLAVFSGAAFLHKNTR